jgi:gamma-glutamyltranspeptidase
MVATAHRLGAIAGLRVMMEGGNAVNATLNVVEPHATGVAIDVSVRRLTAAAC